MYGRGRFERTIGYISLFGFIIIIVTVPFEDSFEKLRYVGYFLAVGPWTLYLATKYTLERWLSVFIQFTVILALGILAATTQPENDLNVSLSYFFSKAGFELIIALTLFNAFPLVWPRKYQQFPRLFLMIRFAALFVVFWSLMSSFASPNPDTSFRYFHKELIVYFMLFLVLLQNLTIRNLRRLMIVAVITGTIVSFIGIGENLLYRFGGYETREWLADKDMVQLEFYQTFNPSIRSQYPFGHHNRLGSYLLIISLMMLVATSLHEGQRKRLMLIALAPAFLAIVFTMTRGALMGTVLGLVAFFVFYRRRYIPALTVIIVAVLLIAPTQIRDRFLSAVQIKSYSSPLEEAITARIYGLTTFGEIISDKPVFGVGYSHKNFSHEFRNYQEDWPSWARLTHTHNNLLEVYAETGIPGGAAFTLFLILIAVIILRKHFATPPPISRSPTAALLGLFVGINAFGLTNYSIRYTIGLLVWIAFAAMVFYSNYSEWLIFTNGNLEEDDFEEF